MNLAKYSIDNKLIVYFFLALMTIGGIAAYKNLPKKEDAPFVVKQAVLICQYPGATSAEVEELITTPIEREIQTMPNVYKLKGESYAGYSYISIELDPGTDPKTMSQMWDELRKKVANIQPYLPSGASQIAVNDDFGDVYGIYFGLTADHGISYQELRDKAQEIKTILTPLSGVRKVTTFAEQTEAVNIFVSPSKLASIGISPDLIIKTLNEQNKIIGVGTKKAGGLNIKVIAEAGYQSVEDIKNQIITINPETSFRLGDIAGIEKGYYEPSNALLRVNGQKAIGIAIATPPDKDVVKAGKLVRETIEKQIISELPYGYSLVELYPEDTIAAKANEDFIINLIASVLIVIALLYFFYKMRATSLIGTALIFSIAATMFVMQFMDVGLNRSSLAAFIIAMGMLVDNAIVVTDMAQNSIKQGMKRRDALIQSANKPMWGLFGATIIGIISFLPMYLANSAAAEIVHPLFVVLSLSLIFSWVFAIMQTTTFGDFMLKENSGKTVKDPYDTRMYNKFDNIIRGLIHRRWITIIVVVMMFVSAIAIMRAMPSNFFPYMSKPYFRADLFLPEGYSIYETSDEMKQIEAHFLKQPGVKKISTAIGSSHPRYFLASTSYSLKPNFANMLIEVNNTDSTAYWEKEFFEYVSNNFPNIICRSSLFQLSMPSEGNIEITFSGTNIDTLQRLANTAMSKINASENAVQFLRTNWGLKTPTYLPHFSEEKGGRLHISRVDMAQALELATSGIRMAEYRERDLVMPILLKSKEIESLPLNQLRTLPVFNKFGKSVLLEQIVDSINIDYQYNMIWHYQRERTIVVRMDEAKYANINATFDGVWKMLQSEMKIPEGYVMGYQGMQLTQNDTNEAIMGKMPIALILIFIILLFLFHDYKKPIAILAMVPLIFIGVVMGLLVLEKDFDFFALLGLLGLIGMNIKAAVVLVDEIVVQTKEGHKPLDAVIYATKTRIIPVAMGSGTTIVGMAPLLGDAMFGGMAATIMGGLLGATILTILVLPVVYCVIHGIKYEKRTMEKN